MLKCLIIIVLFLGIALENYSQVVEDTLCFPRSIIEIKQAKYDQRGLIIQRRDSIISWQINQLQLNTKEINSLNKDKIGLNNIIILKDKDIATEKKLSKFYKTGCIVFGSTTFSFGLITLILILAK